MASAETLDFVGGLRGERKISRYCQSSLSSTSRPDKDQMTFLRGAAVDKRRQCSLVKSQGRTLATWHSDDV